MNSIEGPKQYWPLSLQAEWPERGLFYSTICLRPGTCNVADKIGISNIPKTCIWWLRSEYKTCRLLFWWDHVRQSYSITVLGYRLDVPVHTIPRPWNSTSWDTPQNVGSCRELVLKLCRPYVGPDILRDVPGNTIPYKFAYLGTHSRLAVFFTRSTQQFILLSSTDWLNLNFLTFKSKYLFL